jgi:hypothetical protein
MIKIDLRSGFFQLRIDPRFHRFYGIYYRHQRFAWTRLPMGHPLAPAIMQRFAIAVTRLLHQVSDVTMVAYLDDWLLFSPRPMQVQTILTTLQSVGITVNKKKSILTPTTVLTYLGLRIDTRHLQLCPTATCKQHLLQLATVIPTASRMDLPEVNNPVLTICNQQNLIFTKISPCPN